MIAPAQSLAAIPDDLTAVEAAPLMCAGITTYNALRNSGARAPADVWSPSKPSAGLGILPCNSRINSATER